MTEGHFPWAASKAAVRNWRKALGVSGLDTEGSRELHRRVSREGGAAVRRKYAARSRRSAPPKLKRPWMEGEDQLVRALPGAEAARRTGRALTAVYQRRAALKALARRGQARGRT